MASPNIPQPLENKEDQNMPTHFMANVWQSIVSILWEPYKTRPFWPKTMDFFRREDWEICVTKDKTWKQVIFFISPIYVWDTQYIHLYIAWQYKWKQILKLRNKDGGEEFIRSRMENYPLEKDFVISKIPIISSVPAPGNFYLYDRDEDVRKYMEKRNSLSLDLFFRTYQEFRDVVLAWYIDQAMAESGRYSLQVMYADWRPNAFFNLTGLGSCTTSLSRPNINADLSIKNLLENEWVIGFQILGVFPETTSPPTIA